MSTRKILFAVLVLAACVVVFMGCKEDGDVFIILAENPPVVNPIPDQTSPVNTAFSLDMAPYVSDDNDALIDLTFTVTTGLGSFTGSTYQHTFASVGTETIYFEVQDTKSQAATGMFNVIVYTPPVAEFVADVTSGNPGLEVQFTDLSAGTITSYEWDFDGDSIIDSTAQNPTCTYGFPGTFTVTLTVACAGGSDTETKVDYISVTPTPPTAEFAADVTLGTVPLTVNFLDLSTGDIATWAWDFGDTGTSGVQDPSHTYTAPGWYTVSLTVTGFGGSDTMTKHAYIQVAGNIWYVDSNYGFTSGTGTTSSDPFQEIWSGINATTDLDLVLVADGSYSGASNNDLDFGGKLIALRASGSNCTISAGGGARAFVFQNGETNDAVLDGFMIVGGSTVDAGGAVRCVDSSPTIVNCTLLYNSADTDGGGIAFIGTCTPVVNSCFFQLNNTDAGNGGAIYCESGATPAITSCDFNFNISGQTTPASGGAIYLESSSGATITGCSFDTCIGAVEGGAICATASTLTVEDCEFYGCIAMQYGGAISQHDSILTLTDCELTGNEASSGGGIFCKGTSSVMNVSGSTISRNRAAGMGAGISSLYAIATVQDTTISGNVIESTPSTALGGGMYASEGQWAFTNCTINSNVCASSDDGAGGAGLALLAGGNLVVTMTDCTVSMNRTRSWSTMAMGSGIYAGGVDLTLTNCTVSGNYAAGIMAGGSGLTVESPDGMVATDCTFNGNISEGNAIAYGGGVCLVSGGAGVDITFSDCEVSANSAVLFCDGGMCWGGGIYSDVAEATMINCMVSDNSARGISIGGMMIVGGGGLMSQGTELLLSGSMFSRNTVEAVEGLGAGGGVVLSGTTAATILGCEIGRNAVKAGSAAGSVDSYGGGLYLEDAAVSIADCRITGNNLMVELTGGGPGDVHGGGVFMSSSTAKDVSMANCLIQGNSTFVYGGGVYCADNTNLHLANCTLSGNRTLIGGSGLCLDATTAQATANNCIFWRNTGSVMAGGMQIYVGSGTANLLSCDFADGPGDIGGGGSFNPDGSCINDDPLFVLGPFGKHYLSQVAAGQLSDSPCVDAGNQTAADAGLDTKTTRTDGVADVSASNVDLGYHYEP